MEEYQGKQTCKTLKGIRKKIADANEIIYEPKECTHKGDCAGTCPACEAEVKYLERQLSLRRMAGKAVVIVGLSFGLSALSGCGTTKTVGKSTGPETGLVPNPNQTQTEPERLMGIPPAPPEVVDGPGNIRLEGDVVYVPPQPVNAPGVDKGDKDKDKPGKATKGKKGKKGGKSSKGKKKNKKK